jgi:hypothetical protein
MHLMPYAEKFQVIPRTLTGTDVYGNNVYADGELIDVWGAFDQISGRHPTGKVAGAGSSGRAAGSVGGSEQTVEYDMIYLEQGSYVPGPFDAIIARGVRRTMAQLPTTFRNPFTGFVGGVVLTLKAVEG